MRKILAIVLIIMALASTAVAENASVTYYGEAERFVFLPGSEYSDTDLFENFKNVMPGDTVTQAISLRNRSFNRVRVYMRAEGCSEEDREFLNKLKLNVKTSKDEVFDAQADETAQLTEWVSLGVLRRRSETTLNVMLTVPSELDNSYMNRIGTLAWSFAVEVIDDDLNPETGDRFDSTAWVCCAAAVLAAGVVVLILSRKGSKAE